MIRKALFIVSMLVGSLLSLCAVAQNEAEVIHWWSQGGDAKAVSVLKERFQSSGGHWLQAVESDSDAAREQVVSRLARGYPPTAMQWNAGLETTQFCELGFLNTMNKIGIDENWDSIIPRSVRDLLRCDGHYVGVPVNIHGENWMWSNREIFEKLNLQVPANWEEALEVLPKLRDAGVQPIAVSSQDWQIRILFNSVLVGVAGAEAYYRFYRDTDATLVSDADFLKAVDTFIQIAEYGDESSTGAVWNEQVSAVASGEAALLFMGDWAKGEFNDIGATLGVDYDCHLAPGNDDKYIFVSDVFIFGKISDPREIEVQEHLATIMLDRDFQTEFNQLKGSIPARMDADSSKLDSCAKEAARLMRKPDSAIPFLGIYGDGQFSGAVQSWMAEIWSQPGADRGMFLEKLRRLFEVEAKRRS